jgi:hypothetical protein
LDLPRVLFARQCRQLCLAREKNSDADGALADGDLFAQALATARHDFGPTVFSDDDARAIFDAERDRVADALALAEVLGPQLAASLKTAATVTPTPAASRALERPARPPLPASTNTTSTAALAGPLEIADLLDGMLAQDRHDASSRR